MQRSQLRGNKGVVMGKQGVELMIDTRPKGPWETWFANTQGGDHVRLGVVPDGVVCNMSQCLLHFLGEMDRAGGLVSIAECHNIRSLVSMTSDLVPRGEQPVSTGKVMVGGSTHNNVPIRGCMANVFGRREPPIIEVSLHEEDLLFDEEGNVRALPTKTAVCKTHFALLQAGIDFAEG
jgi:hypothetical protein